MFYFSDYVEWKARQKTHVTSYDVPKVTVTVIAVQGL